MHFQGEVVPQGNLGLKVIRGGAWTPTDWPSDPTWREFLRVSAPQEGLPQSVNAWRWKNFRRVLGQYASVSWAKRKRENYCIMVGSLYLTVIRRDGEREEFGLASLKVVTTAGATKIVDFLRASDTVTGAAFKFHGLGTGTNAEASGDTTLQTELTTQYNPDNTRATGTQTNNGATVYRTVGTNTVDATAAVTEHGVLSQAATGGGTLLDRSVFSVINLASGDGIQATYDLSVPAGS